MPPSYDDTPLHPSGLEVGVETLGAMLSRPLLKEIEIEREVILEEMLARHLGREELEHDAALDPTRSRRTSHGAGESRASPRARRGP